MDKLKKIATKFAVNGTVSEIKALGAGFINDTFKVITEGNAADYILQRKNKNIFPDVPAMMDNICAVTAHLRLKAAEAGDDPDRSVLTVVRTLDGLPYYIDDEGQYWAMCVYINGSVTYDRADTPALAYMGGAGIGRFQSQLADFPGALSETIKGFHNIRYRFEQWDRALARDAAGRCASLSEEIGMIESRRRQMLEFHALIESGEIPCRVPHNDTKISNILFDTNGNVLCVIDLDTVMSSSSLYDFGDAIRSYANTGDEDDRDLSRVGLSTEMFRAYTEGYLSQRLDTLTPSETSHMAFSALYITFEQVLRFLMDYIDGDKYYKIQYPEHNLVRTLAQYRLLQSMEQHYSDMCAIVNNYISSHK